MARIELTLPRERDFGAVADLVLAGLAARLDLTLETIDDLQLALETLVRQDGAGDEVTIAFTVEERALEVSVGPFQRSAIEPDLAAAPAGDGIGLRRLLDTTVDDVRLRDENGVCWVELRKERQP